MAEPIRIFYSCSDSEDDKKILSDLEKYLAPLRKKGLIDDWHRYQKDKQLNKVIQQEIEHHLNTAHIILLLVSHDFLDSIDCCNEAARALTLRSAQHTHIIPIIVRPCLWEHEEFAKLQVLPANKRPISSETMNRREKVVHEIAQTIHTLVQEIYSTSPTTNTTHSVQPTKQSTPKITKDVVTIQIHSRAKATFGGNADYTRDWTNYFTGPDHRKNAQTIHPDGWNTLLWPEINTLTSQVKQKHIKFQGTFSLSLGMALGYAFGEVTGKKIEVYQSNIEKWFRTDAKKNKNFQLIPTTSNVAIDMGQLYADKGDTIALGVGITSLVDNDVRRYLQDQTTYKIAATLMLCANRDLGNMCIKTAGDAVALADEVKTNIATLTRTWQAKRVLLFYKGPISGAFFIGHRLNSSDCSEIQIMEFQTDNHTYIPSFLIHS